MTSHGNHTDQHEGEESDKLPPLIQKEIDLDDLWRESWSDEEDDMRKKRQLKAVSTPPSQV